MQAAKVIYLPLMVVFCGNRLVETTPKEFSSIFGFRPARGGRVLCANASLPRMRATHLLDRRGFVHHLRPSRKRRAFLSWFAQVWDFTWMECVVETAGPLKVGELLTEAEHWNNNSGQKMRRFLGKQNPEVIFDEAMFRQSWEATYVKLPESEWSKVFELRH